MPDRPHLRLIIYDVSDNRRRRKLAAILEEVAARVQESAFEARLTTTQLARLRRKLAPHVTEDDSLRIYSVPDTALPHCHVTGGPLIADGARFWLL